MDDLPLFTQPVPPMTRQPDHATSHEAARSVRPVASGLRARILQLIRGAGEQGYTDNELRYLQEFAGYAHSTVGKRRSELYQMGFLAPAGTRDGFTVWIIKPETTSHD